MHSFGYLPEILLLLFASIFTVVLMTKLKLSPVLGYLVIGALISHYNLITDEEYTKNIAEFGVVFLLFVIGLELTFERLMRMKVFVFGFGGLQILITTIAMALFCNYFLNLDLKLSILIGSALSLSSTAIVMQVLSESNRQATQVGRLSISVLLMQDFAVVPLLTILPILAANSGGMLYSVGEASLKAIIIIVLITIAGRLFLRPFFSIIGSAKKEEIYVNTALLIVLGAAWFTNNQGLSTAMGAFLAGLLIAETEYRNKIEDSILPFQGLFMALFFISTGMSIDIISIISNFPKVLILSAIIITMKFLVILALCRMFKFNLGSSINAGLLLSQVGEFAFILFDLANQQRILNDELTDLLMMTVVFTMAITPLLAMFGTAIEGKLWSNEAIDSNNEFKGVSDLSSHVIIAGFGRAGRIIAYILEEEQIDYIGLDSNISLVKQARAQGYPVYHGDMSNHDILKAVGIERASSVILSMTDKSSLMKATKLISQEHKNIPIIARVEDAKHAKGIRKLGATAIIQTTTEIGIQLASALLHNMNVPEHEIISIKNKLRKNEYSLTEEIELFKGIRKIKNVPEISNSTSESEVI